jgi:hypothetical protein
MSTPLPADPVPNAHELLDTLSTTLASLREFTEWLQAATDATDLAAELAAEAGERMPDEDEIL